MGRDAWRYRLRAGVRHTNRLRWRTKLHNVRAHGGRGNMSRRAAWRYVMWSPELGDFTADFADRDCLVRFVSTTLATSPARVRELIAELEHDDEFRGMLEERRRPTLLDADPPFGQRYLWYAIVRILKPSLAVETGVWYGLGSAVLLRALERNAEEGNGGELISFDPDPTAGWLVHPAQRENWRLVRGTTEDSLASVLQKREIGFFVCDTPPTYDRARHELEIALAHAGPRAAIVNGSGNTSAALSDLCSERGLKHHLLRYELASHFYSNAAVELTVTPAQSL